MRVNLLDNLQSSTEKIRTGSKDSVSKKKHQLQISADGRSKMMLVNENNTAEKKSRNSNSKFITLTN